MTPAGTPRRRGVFLLAREIVRRPLLIFHSWTFHVSWLLLLCCSGCHDELDFNQRPALSRDDEQFAARRPARFRKRFDCFEVSGEDDRRRLWEPGRVAAWAKLYPVNRISSAQPCVDHFIRSALCRRYFQTKSRKESVNLQRSVAA